LWTFSDYKVILWRPTSLKGCEFEHQTNIPGVLHAFLARLCLCNHSCDYLHAAIVVAARWLSLAEEKWRSPYPVRLVIDGGLRSVCSGLPAVKLDPDMCFSVCCRRLLYPGGRFTSWRDFERT